MLTKAVELPDDLAAEIEARVANGEAASAADIVRAGLQALDENDARRLDALREKIARSLNDPRPSVPLDEALDDVKAMLAELRGR